MKKELAGVLFIECAIKTKEELNFSEITGFNHFNAFVWTHRIIQFDYVKGNSKIQDFEFVLNVAASALIKQYGRKNINFISYFESFTGSRTKLID